MSYQREFEKRIKVGIVGAGTHSYRNILPALNYLPVELKAICDPNPDLAEKTADQYGCAAFPGLKEMAANIELDAVMIAVGAKYHRALILEALELGLHVWVEKPIALRTSHVEEMLKAKNDRIVVAGFKKAFMPATEKALEIVRSSRYGNLRSILSAYKMTIPENGAEVLESGEPPNWLNNGVHPLSFMLEVGGTVRSVTTHRSAHDHGVVILEYASGAVGTLHLGSGPHKLEFYTVYGEEWYLEIKNARVTLERGVPFEYNVSSNYTSPGDDTGAVVWEPSNCLATLENKALFTQGFIAEMEYFCRCVLTETQPSRGNLEFAREMMRVYEAALVSDGRTVSL